HQQALVLQALGHFAVDDALRQAFDDRGLADARLADQHRVVLGAALQDLDAAADLVVASDDRVELALAGPVGQVERVLRESLALPPSSWLRRAASRCWGSMYWWSWPSALLCASARASCSLVVNFS